MKKFVADADTVLVETFERKYKAGQLLINGTLNDVDCQVTDRNRLTETRQNKIQQTIEHYMLLVNASFLLEPWGAYEFTRFEYMNGIEFPGLWSRVLYQDATPNKIYRNVGGQPTTGD